MKILAISDVAEPVLYGASLSSYAAGVETVISCGDLAFEYLEYVVTFSSAPVCYVLATTTRQAMIREERVLAAFLERTGLDLYLWIVCYRDNLALESRDEFVTTSAAKDNLVKREGRTPRRPNPLNIYS